MGSRTKYLTELGLRTLRESDLYLNEQEPFNPFKGPPTSRPKDIPPHKNLNLTPVEKDLGPLGSPEIGKVVDGRFRTGRWTVSSQPIPSRSEKGTIGPSSDGSQYFSPEEMPVPVSRPRPEDYADTSLTRRDLYGPAVKGQERPFFPHLKLPDLN